MGLLRLWKGVGKVKNPTRKTDVWATLYDVVGSVKRHLEFTSRDGSFFSSTENLFSFLHRPRLAL